MPGRYFLFSSTETVSAHFGVEIAAPFPPRYNIAPTQPVALIRQGMRGREFALARWDFLPGWAKKPNEKPQINARSESVSEKPFFRSAFKRRRCLIPANGFYEWVGEKTPKRAFCFRPAGVALFAFAGVWETAVDPDGGEIDTVAILTTDPGPDIRPIHNRSGVIIPPEGYGRWLEADERDVEGLSDLFAPQPAGFWRVYEVSAAVSNIRNDGPELTEPLPTQQSLL